MYICIFLFFFFWKCHAFLLIVHWYNTCLSSDHLKKPLEDYVAQLGKVRILRTTKREGLIRARLLGAKAAKAQVLTFLDAHCEANVNWLEPLLDRIRQDPTTVAVPVIDIIGSSDFSYSGTPAEVIGGFSWDMQFNWHSLPFSVRNQRREASDPIRLVLLCQLWKQSRARDTQAKVEDTWNCLPLQSHGVWLFTLSLLVGGEWMCACLFGRGDW